MLKARESLLAAALIFFLTRSAQAILAGLLATATETNRAGFFSSRALIHLALTAPFSLDEFYLKIDGRLVYLWRAVDAEGKRSMCWPRPGGTSGQR